MKAIDLSVNIAGLNLKNPVMTASGTFGYGREYDPFYDLSLLGAIMVKGLSTVPWQGNDLPRIVETPSGMLNAIGLQNPGVDAYIRDDLAFLRRFDTKIIVNVIGKTIEEYADVVRHLEDHNGADAYELNISCPNIKEGGISFGSDPNMAAAVVRAVRQVTDRPIIPKLSPNVTSIREMARACEEAGADALSAINTLLAMVIDVDAEKPVLANQVGGLSGPAIRPVAVRVVWEAYDEVNIPVIGMGGISTAHDAFQFTLAGASAIAVGTSNFTDPTAPISVIKGLEEIVKSKGGTSYGAYVGAAHIKTRS